MHTVSTDADPRLLGLRWSTGPVGAHWQLGSMPPGRSALLDWVLDAPARDAGAPRQVAQLLAAVMVASGTVVAAGGDATVRSPWRDRLAQAAVGRGSRLRGVVATRDVARVAEAFDDPQHPWWLQGQAFFVFDAPQQARRLEAAAFEAAVRADSLAGASIVLRPAVDGDAAAVVAVDPQVLQAFLAALQHAAAQHGVAWGPMDDEPPRAAAAAGPAPRG